MHVNRCVCHNVTFRELLRLSDQLGDADFETLQERTNCGRGCGMCVPFIRVALRDRLERVPLEAVHTVGQSSW